MAIVYKITNTENGKAYVGLSVRTLHLRWQAHLSSARNGSPFRFHSAIRKYGAEAWKLEVLCESDDLLFIRKEEERIIEELELTSKGYNAKPGGCGGWIVPDEKLDAWKAKISDRTKGDKNPNVLAVTNEELVELAVDFYKEHGHIPGHKKLIDYGELKGIKVPKSFTNYRFEGKYANLVSLVELLTGAKYNKYFRSPEHREKLAAAHRGKHWYSCDALEVSIMAKEESLDSKYTWYKGRIYDPID